VLLENLLRNGEDEGAEAVAKWSGQGRALAGDRLPPARVLMQDFTGVPAIVDLAAMRDAMEELGGDATKINPLVPVELVIDHSIQVDVFAERLAFQRNASSSSSATASATPSCAGARRRSTTSRWCRPTPASATR
jgi:aconitate hydratase